VSTSLVPELALRQLQLTEIRAMLGLMKDATHEEVIRRLADIGRTDRRVDLSMIPDRYRAMWPGRWPG
jgi:hypothetical protein